MNGGVFLNGLHDGFGLDVGAVDVAKAAEIDEGQQAVRREIVGVALQNFIGFRDRVADALCLPVHFRQALADDGRERVVGVRLLVRVDRAGGVFAGAGLFVLLLENVAHGEVVVSVGANGIFAHRGGLRGSGVLGQRG